MCFFWDIAFIFAAELSQIWKKILTLPCFINRILFRRPPPSNVEVELGNMLNSTMNNSNLNSRNANLTARATDQCSGVSDRNVCRRTQSLNLRPIYKQKCRNIVWMDAKQGIVQMKRIRQELLSTASL